MIYRKSRNGVTVWDQSGVPTFYPKDRSKETDEYIGLPTFCEKVISETERREKRDMDMLLNRNKEPNLASTQMESLKVLSSYIKASEPLVSRVTLPADSTSSKPAFLMSDEEKKESVFKTLLPGIYKP